MSSNKKVKRCKMPGDKVVNVTDNIRRMAAQEEADKEELSFPFEFGHDFLSLKDKGVTDDELNGPRKLYMFCSSSLDDAHVTSVFIRGTSKMQVCRHILAHPECCDKVLYAESMYFPDTDVMYNAAQLLRMIESCDYAGCEIINSYSLVEVRDEQIVEA